MYQTKLRSIKRLKIGLILLVVALSLYLLDIKNVPDIFLGLIVGVSINFIISSLWILSSKKTLHQVSILNQDEREKIIRLKSSDLAFRVLMFGLTGFIIFKSIEQDESVLILVLLMMVVTGVDIIGTFWFRERG
jgi:hypothetical protein